MILHRSLKAKSTSRPTSSMILRPMESFTSITTSLDVANTEVLVSLSLVACVTLPCHPSISIIGFSLSTPFPSPPSTLLVRCDAVHRLLFSSSILSLIPHCVSVLIKVPIDSAIFAPASNAFNKQFYLFLGNLVSTDRSSLLRLMSSSSSPHLIDRVPCLVCFHQESPFKSKLVSRCIQPAIVQANSFPLRAEPWFTDQVEIFASLLGTSLGILNGNDEEALCCFWNRWKANGAPLLRSIRSLKKELTCRYHALAILGCRLVPSKTWSDGI